MKFKDLQINQRFKFLDNPKIYKKVRKFSATRHLKDYFVHFDAEVELVKENEEENYEEVQKRSYYNYLVHEEGAKYPNENN